MAAVRMAAQDITPGMTIGLGSGRAVFALVEEIGRRLGMGDGTERDTETASGAVSAVTASPVTAEFVHRVGLRLADIDGFDSLDVTFDGADEIDPAFRMIKGGGIALLHEKLLITASKRTVIIVQSSKCVERLGLTRSLPVEIVRYGWQHTRERVRRLLPGADLRRHAAGQAIITPEGNFLLDADLPERGESWENLEALATQLKQTLGVVDHGLFLNQVDELIVGNDDGSARRITREAHSRKTTGSQK